MTIIKSIIDYKRQERTLVSVSNPSPYIRKVSSKVGFRLKEGTQYINWADIIYCKSDSNYTHVHLKGLKKILVSKTMGLIEGILPKSNFIRIHNSYLVNIDHISWSKKYELTLVNGDVIPISRPMQQKTKQFLNAKIPTV